MEYPGVSPELSFLKDMGRAEFYTATDSEALDGNGMQRKKYFYKIKILISYWEGIKNDNYFDSNFDFIILAAYKLLCRMEGIFPSLEASHALAFLEKLCPTLANGTKVVVNCSGRGDKDAATVLFNSKKSNY